MKTAMIEFLLDRILEDEAIAQAAIDPERPGVHWEWVTTETDTPVAPGQEQEALEHQNISLRSVEEFPTSAGTLPAFAIHAVEELGTGVGQFITHHDPARMLAEYATKRSIIGYYQMLIEQEKQAEVFGFHATGLGTALRFMAKVYEGHPDYQEDWA